jgi:hypothetical protein
MAASERRLFACTHAFSTPQEGRKPSECKRMPESSTGYVDVVVRKG